MVDKKWFAKLFAAFKRRPQSVVINVSINGIASGGHMNGPRLEEIRQQTALGIRDALRSVNGR